MTEATIESKPAIARRQPVQAAPLPELHEQEKVTFADLVLAHHLRQSARYRAAQLDATSEEAALAEVADAAYRDRLTVFEREHGPIVRAYWCTYEISGVAITEESVKLPWWRLG